MWLAPPDEELKNLIDRLNLIQNCPGLHKFGGALQLLAKRLWGAVFLKEIQFVVSNAAPCGPHVPPRSQTSSEFQSNQNLFLMKFSCFGSCVGRWNHSPFFPWKHVFFLFPPIHRCVTDLFSPESQHGIQLLGTLDPAILGKGLAWRQRLASGSQSGGIAPIHCEAPPGGKRRRSCRWVCSRQGSTRAKASGHLPARPAGTHNCPV